MNYETEEIKELILCYLKKDYFGSDELKITPRESSSLYSELKLKNKIILGEDLIYALKDLKLKEIIEDERQIQDMSSDLEELVKGKEGSIVDDIKSIIKKYNPKTTSESQ